ncbi:sugar transferase [Marinobacter sp. M4C]|nr:sugar transferase [Marinobacter sp. M4C]UQG63228.1 sugar transferase [Marinobacter sp. M2C]UQG67506.1 sugar transferase [Marinobacter sp. M1C]
MLIRALDFLLSLLGLLAGLPFLLVLYLVGLFDTGKPLFFQQRVGRQQQPFILVKFRTMPVNTESVASHLVGGSAVTSYGRFLRRTKLDELPQLWNVLKGEMSLVGPRPCLFNQHELIDARARLGVYVARPGVTGLAQTTGIDMSTPELLAQTDAKMLHGLTLGGYFRYLFRTLLGQGKGDGTFR